MKKKGSNYCGKMQNTTPLDIQVRIDRLLDGDGPTKAFASATIGNAFAVHDIRISEKDDGIKISMPFRTYTVNGEKKYTDTFHPITAESRTELYDAVKDSYEQALEQQMADLEHESAGMSQQM